MSGKSPVHEIRPGEGYDIESDDYDTDEERDNVPEDELDDILEEAENGFTPDEMDVLTYQLKEEGLVNFLRGYLTSQATPDGEMGSLRKLLLGFGIIPPAHLRAPSTPNFALLPFTRSALSRILRRRAKLPQYNTIHDAIRLLKTSKNIIVLSGAGISTSCGIPDFRSSQGLYAQLQREGNYELDDPQQMFDINYFKERPEVFYSFAKQIYPSNFIPSPCHRWIKLLEDKGLLLRNYTQNIDTLESQAGVQRVLQCHGSFKTASCLRCKRRVPGNEIESYIMSQTIPYCENCRQSRQLEVESLKVEKEARRKAKGKGKGNSSGWGSGSGSDDGEEESEWGKGEPGIMKPDITFFGQALSSKFDECLFRDREKVDLLIVIGTSLKVAPVSEVLTHIPHSVPQIYINLEPVTHVQPDICLLGEADKIVTYLAKRLGWKIPPPPSKPTPQSQSDTASSSKVESSSECDNADQSESDSSDDSVWLSGVGEMGHMHFLSSPEDRSRMASMASSSLTSLASSSLDTVDDGEADIGDLEAELGEMSDRGKLEGGGDMKSDLTTKVEQVTVSDQEDGRDHADRPTKRSRIEEEVL